MDEVLQSGSGMQYGKYRIYDQFRKQQTTKENAAFLKHEYGIGGRYPATRSEKIDETHDGKGIKLTRGSILEPDEVVTLTWSKVAKRIGELIAADRYLSQAEKDSYPGYLQWLEKRHGENEPELAADSELQPVSFRVSPGDTVHIGIGQFEIVDADAHIVHLADLSFPLLQKEMPRDEFDRKLRENPLNNHLQVDSADVPEAENTAEPDVESFLPPEPEESPEVLVGKRYIIDDREFIVDRINTESDEITLRDVTFQNGVGFPIFRTEPLDFIQQYTPVAEPTVEPEPKTAALDKSEKNKENTSHSVVNFSGEIVLVKEKMPVNDADRRNFRITDNNLGVGGAKTKFRNNIAAIQTLQNIEFENRLATPEEQEILSRYVGWGGLPQAFDPDNKQWENEYLELHALLSPDEYTSARASTLNAHYTSPVVIKAIYQAIENMGFKTGNILDPGCGIGNFQGLLPESMSDSKLYGVELDSITGRIARQLYPKNSIAIQGYEKTDLPDSFFDLAIGNVPFGNFGVSDKRYDKHKFNLHDYFFAKTLDKVRPGGIIAFITSKGTLDKENPSVRKYIAQRAELLGAIRLPNTAFKANAGTEVTTDILFLQKRDRMVDIEPEWVHMGKTETGIPVNQFFLNHPDMMLGTMSRDDGVRMYGNKNDTTCIPFPDSSLEDQLSDAIAGIHGEITDSVLEDTLSDVQDSSDTTLAADPNTRNYSYAIVDGKIYFRQDSRMTPSELSVTAQSRVKGMVGIRDCVRTLIEYQTEDYPDEDIHVQQGELNQLYDAYTAKYGLLNSRANSAAFSSDSAYPLLCSLEVIDENGNLARKADMFSKRTIKPNITVTHVDTASEALAVSLAEKAGVDLPFMATLLGGEEKIPTIVQELEGVIFKDPLTGPFDLNGQWATGWRTADEYLSGNVRIKLRTARAVAQHQPEFAGNVRALEAVQPKDLAAGEISVRLGATWIPPDVVQQFMVELLKPNWRARDKIKLLYSSHTGEWNITAKSSDNGNIHAVNTYGTNRINAYGILQDTLNLKDVRIFDTVIEDGREKRVLNRKATAIAQDKQDLIKQKFSEWIWADPARRERLCTIYNEQFNHTRPREYDGQHIRFSGINPEIRLRTHQINAIARILYGGNTLLGHVVGAGKTFEMIAAGMESKRLGLCGKPMYVVPNNIIGDFAADFMRLYPSANILMATKKDFETKNRKKFCARIATGDYDGIIIGHSQFEKIPMSVERQCAILERQIDDIAEGIADVKAQNGERFSIKQMEKSRKALQSRLSKLNDQSRKDDLVTFEELGVDQLFVDEADLFKNLFLYTKMRNVAGISQTEAQKSSDLFMKTQYLNELTGSRGVIFATGTPVSNSMAELFTMQRFLQYDTLTHHGLSHFDSWASTFGETVTALELAPEGTGFRQKTRFANFYNLPELMSMFKEVADIQTADMLNLPIPKVNAQNVVVKPTQLQKDMIAALAERADAVRKGTVDPSSDNMLLITNDGRKIALDQRLVNAALPDDPNSKVNTCIGNVFDIWEKNREQRLTQLVFCDLSTPKNNGNFNLYDDIRDKLTAMGVPREEIAFIHEANNEAQKKDLFAKVRTGQIRVLIGSTSKCGAGTNIQDKLIALHNLDCPWRPRDLEQRRGRIARQGNKNAEVGVFRYVTEETFDSYLYQTLERKQRFISQVFTSKSPARVMEEIDEATLSYAEIKALATGNPQIIEKCNLDAEVGKLNMLKSSHLNQKYELEDKLIKFYPQEIKRLEDLIAGYESDQKIVQAHTPAKDSWLPMTVQGITYTKKAEAGQALLDACQRTPTTKAVPIGEYRGFPLALSFDAFSKEYFLIFKGTVDHTVSLGPDAHGNITRIDNALDGMESKLSVCRNQLESVIQQREAAQTEVEKPFSREDELKEKRVLTNI